MNKNFVGLGLENPRLAVEDFKNRLINRFGNRIQSMTLFGSVARKDYSPDSDIDVLVIVQNSTDKLRREITGIGFEELLSHGWYVSTKVIGKEDFDYISKLGTPFIKDISKDGVMIYGKDIRTG